MLKAEKKNAVERSVAIEMIKVDVDDFKKIYFKKFNFPHYLLCPTHFIIFVFNFYCIIGEVQWSKSIDHYG